ncbi:hypothetical protein BJX99DRAFT_272364 [Aspergillus californicus]
MQSTMDGLIYRLFPIPDLDHSVSSANSALSPPPHPTNPSSIRDSSHLSAPLQSPFISPGVSTRSAAGSPGPSSSPRNRTGAPNQQSTIPSLPKLREPLDSSTTSPEDKKAESSIYYTTAWGSPYAAPSPRRLSWSLSQYGGGIDRESGESSPISIQFGLEPNRPDILHNLNAPGSPAKELDTVDTSNFEPDPEREGASRRGKSIQDFTQDWINQYISGRQRTERSNWLSDDSGSEAPSFITAQNHFADDASDDWLGLEHESRDQELLKTPTLSDFVNRRAAARREGASNRPNRPGTKEVLHKRADTLRQEDFWGFAYDKDPEPIPMAAATETQHPAGMDPKMQWPSDKPLPAPPVEETEPTSLPTTINQQPAKSSPLPQRQRKKIPWRGKGCVIGLPFHDIRGTEESGYRLLTTEDVNQRLQHWQNLGYDVRGFSVSASEDPSNISLGGASRPIYPDAVDMQDDIKPGKYTVKVPNKALWDEYVNFLQEEKLRALGSPSPASGFNSMTPFPGLVSSPPIPTASATSNPLSMHQTFSPHLTQGGNVNTGIASLASPASQFGAQTPFYGVDQGIMPGFLPFQPTPPTHGSLTPQSFINLRQSGPTSTIPGTLSSLTSMLSPVSPMNDSSAFHPGFGDQFGQPKDVFDEQFHHHAPDYFDDDQVRSLRTPPPNPDNFHASTVEIAQPTPRGHSRGHNLSETLQKGIDQVTPDYHLEESIERELEEGDHDPMQNHLHGPGSMSSRWGLPENSFPQHIPQHLNQFYGEHYAGEVAHEGSDIDTNPSLSGTPRRNGSLAHHIPWHESKPSAGSYTGGHRSKLSASSLNVAAKEFAPTGPAPPQQFPFKSGDLQFPTSDQPMFTFGSRTNEQPPARLNVAAPTFTPGKIGSAVKFGQNIGSREFKFSAPESPASLNVAAPEFSPGRTKIFEHINVSEIVQPEKKSAAVPIVRPDEEKEDDNKEGQDEHGRTIPTDRHKRRRGSGVPGSEASYSMSNALGETNNFQPPQPLKSSNVPAEGKENALPGQDKNMPSMKVIPEQSEDPIERRDTPISEASTWAPSETRAANAHIAGDSIESDEIRHEGPEMDREKPLPEVLEGSPSEQGMPIEEPKPAEGNSKHARLSAAAKSFSFKASTAEFMPVGTEAPVPPPKDTPPKGLMSSRYAVASPPPSPPGRQLSTELSAAVDVEVEEDVSEDVPEAVGGKTEEGRRDTEDGQDSLDEDQLNAVMDQLNGDSDVGIERLSTPQPATHMPESVLGGPSKEKRHVGADNRSEPPSPSPGRGPVPHSLNVPKLDFNAQSHFSGTPSKNVISAFQSPVRQLLSRNEHISDWDDVISSGEEAKLANRSRFFDRRINDLLSSAIDERFNPLEHALSAIQQSLVSLNSAPQNAVAWRSASAEVIDSDADDEDDDYEEDASYRTRSPLQQKERKLEKLKSIVLEALATRDLQPAPEQPPNEELLQLRDRIAELHTLTTQRMSQDHITHLKDVMQEVLTSQLNQPDSLMLQIQGLKEMLRLTDERSESEHLKRVEAEDTATELRRLAAAESAEARLLQFQEEKMPYFENIQQRASVLEKERESDRLTLDELSSKNIGLQNTIDEHRFASDNAKRESEDAKARLEEIKGENLHLRIHVGSMKQRIEDGLNIRQNLSEKFDVLQDDMARLTEDEEDLNAKYAQLRTSHNRESRLREQLEMDIAKLEEQEREAAKLKFIFGQSQQENARLEELAAHYEREFIEARESSRTDLDAAISQVNINKLSDRYEMLLEEAQETKDLAMEEQRKLHERVLNDLRERHARALHNSSEDKQRAESHQMERMALLDEKNQHLLERSAARAAAEAAQSRRPASPAAPSHSSSPSMSFDKGSSLPDKISPQALRESIFGRIDELEHELSTVDKDAPTKIKERDTEINWLRELLGPSFNQHSVRDAAIRLKANVQMQQQEKERAMNGQSFPSFPSISDITASPRSLPLAAAAATNASDQTPSKSPATTFLSGLLTPPSSNTRQTSPNGNPPPAPSWRRPSESRPLKSFDTTPRPLSSRAAGNMREPPTTPPLLRRSSYDHDAEPTDYTQSSAFDEEESTADGLVSASPKETGDDGPFGPQIQTT